MALTRRKKSEIPEDQFLPFSTEVVMGESEAKEFLASLPEGAFILDNDGEEIREPEIIIKRFNKTMVDKTKTPMFVLEEQFILSRMDRGTSTTTIKYYRRSNRKLNQFIGFNAPRTSADYKAILKRLEKKHPDKEWDDLESILGMSIPIVILESEAFQADYIDYLRTICKVNDQTIKSYLRGYRVLAYFAMEQGYINRRNIVIPDTEAPIKNCYTDAELTRLLAPPDKDKFTEYRDWVIVNFLIATGCRVSTLVDVNIGDIDFEEGMITLNRQKNKSPTRIAMARKLSKILSEYIDAYLYEQSPKDALFPRYTGDRATEDILKKSIASYNKKRKVLKTSIHLFRHTFAKNWIISGGDIITLQKILNHKSLKMVNHYANIYGSDIAPQVEEFALINRIEAPKGGKKLQRRGK